MMKSNGMRRFFAACLVTFVFVGCIGAAAMLVKALWPSTGEDVCVKGDFTLDVSHASEGYIMAKREACSSGLKMRISKGNAVYTYDLNNKGEYEVFPLQMGSGNYKVRVFEQVKGSQYSGVSSVSFSAAIGDESLPYLYPSQYVSYEADSQAVTQALAICNDLDSAQDKMDAVVRFVSGKFMYDYMGALLVQDAGTYLPDIDKTLETRKGICFDFAALVCCMLRAQGIPTKLVIGYADHAYHAWNQVYIDDQWQLVDTTAMITGTIVRRYTPERWY